MGCVSQYVYMYFIQLKYIRDKHIPVGIFGTLKDLRLLLNGIPVDYDASVECLIRFTSGPFLEEVIQSLLVVKLYHVYYALDFYNPLWSNATH